MTDVEELLRDTLADPRRKLDAPGGLYESVRDRARSRQHRRTAMVATAAVVVVAAGGALAATWSSGQRGAGPSVASTPSGPPSAERSGPPPHGTLDRDIYAGPGAAASIAIATTPATAVRTASPEPDFYVLTQNPSSVLRRASGADTNAATAQGPSGSPSGLAIGSVGPLWAWSQDTGQVRAYNRLTLAPLGTFDTELSIFNGAVVDGQLWLATAQGLTHEDPAADANASVAPTTPVAGVTGTVYSLAPDPARHRVIVASVGGQIEAVDTRTGHVTIGATTGLNKPSVTVVDGQVWVGGYADDTPLVVHLDGATLRVIASLTPPDIGPGAIVWPGANVLWVGNYGLADCLDPKSGATLEQWPTLGGPVASVKGSAAGISNGQVFMLGGMTNGCLG